MIRMMTGYLIQEKQLSKNFVGNEEGWADGENVIATISSDDDRISILR